MIPTNQAILVAEVCFLLLLCDSKCQKLTVGNPLSLTFDYNTTLCLQFHHTRILTLVCVFIHNDNKKKLKPFVLQSLIGNSTTLQPLPARPMSWLPNLPTGSRARATKDFIIREGRE